MVVHFTFVRHGETDYNKNGILQGHLNIPLNSKGRQQAASVGDKLSKDLPINLIISSDLDRAFETASIIRQQIIINNNSNGNNSQSLLPNIESTPLLRERNLGKLEGVDLRHLVHWEELPESKKAIEIQKLLNQKPSLTFLPPLPPPQSSSSLTPLQQQQVSLQNQLNQLYIEQQQAQAQAQAQSLSHSGQLEPIHSQLSSPSLSSTATSYTSAATSVSSSMPSSPRSSLASSSASNFSNSSTSSFSSISSSLEIPISLTSTSTPTNVKLSSNILKHLPQKELKMESKSKLIRRAKEAFQHILRQIPSKYINSTTSDIILPPTQSPLLSSSSTNSNYHILIVSHSVILRTILSLLLCKKSAPIFCNINNNSDISQSEASSSQNFKWIQFELKNASTIKASFSVFEKKSRDLIKRIPRDITFYQESNESTNSSNNHKSKSTSNNTIINNNNNNNINNQKVLSQVSNIINNTNNSSITSNSGSSNSSSLSIEKQQPLSSQSIVILEKNENHSSSLVSERVVPSFNDNIIKESDFFNL